jgi:hypothetical protein
VLHGVPAADFSADELMYLPRNVRSHRLYGMSPVEQIALTINIALRRDAATLDYYNSGSVPDSFATLPKEWTADQIRSFQDYFDALMSGNSARRRMLKFMPAEFKLIEARQPPLKDQYDEWLARIVCYAFSVPVSPFITQVNRATSQTLRLQATQEGLVPLKAWVKALLDSVIQTCLGSPDLEFAWVGDDAIDPLQQAQTLQILVGAGIKTREEARAELGLGGEGKPGAGALGKFNPNHDPSNGQFTTADGAGATISDANNAPNSTAQTLAVAANLVIVRERPESAVANTSGDGVRFWAPTKANFREVFAAGRASGQSPFAAAAAIGQFGTFDFQRDGDNFYTVYTDASNYAVGVYMAGAGFSLAETIAFGRLYAWSHSSNAGAQSQVEWWKRGWNDATNSAGPFGSSP